MLGLLLLIPCVGLITSVEPVAVIGQLGSDLHLEVTEACQLNGPFRYDIYYQTLMIGTFDSEQLRGLKDYWNRLTYDKRTCRITLRNLTEQDGKIFNVKLYEVINGRSTEHDITYNVTIIDPLTTRPYTPEKEHKPTEPTVRNTSTSGHLSFASFCMALESPINVLLTLVVWIIQSGYELKEEGVDFGCKINCCVTFICEFISIAIMSSGNLYCWHLVAFPIILLFDIVGYSVLPPLGDEKDLRWKKVALYIWSAVTLLSQVSFAIFVGLLHYRSDDESPTNGYVAVPVIAFLALKIGVFIVTYCYKTKCNYKQVSRDDL